MHAGLWVAKGGIAFSSLLCGSEGLLLKFEWMEQGMECHVLRTEFVGEHLHDVCAMPCNSQDLLFSILVGLALGRCI